jgi:cob(I)alamin adenosyltransferase
MSIYTRTGDAGETSLAGGTRVSKADSRVEAYGTVDEAACAVGLALEAATDARMREVLLFAQQRLLNCSSRLATPPDARTAGTADVDDQDVRALELAIDEFETRAGPPERFVLPGGSELAARLHVARTVVRRAERRVAAIASEDRADDGVARFLNRLSDMLFASARAALKTEGVPETGWDPDASRPAY